MQFNVKRGTSTRQVPISHIVGVDAIIAAGAILIPAPLVRGTIRLAKSYLDFLMAKRVGPALVAGTLLLVDSCLAASGLEVKQDAKAPASLEFLAASLNSTNAETRFYALNSLGKIGGSETINPLVKWKRRSKSAAGGGPIVQHPTAVNAFTFCGSSKALTVRSVN
jgi:hypothetical protein